MTVQDALRARRRNDLLTAELILRDAPEQISSRVISDFLRDISFVPVGTVRLWCRRAQVDPLNLAGDLTYQQRMALVIQLASHRKAQRGRS